LLAKYDESTRCVRKTKIKSFQPEGHEENLVLLLENPREMRAEAKNLIFRIELMKEQLIAGQLSSLHDLHPNNQVLCLRTHLAMVSKK